MPYTIKNPPRPAKNWTAEEKRKCVKVANAVLKKGGSEQDAIFACIKAAGRSTKRELEMAGNSRQRRKQKRAQERRRFEDMKKRLETMTGREHTDEEVKQILDIGEVPETVFTPDDEKINVNVDIGEIIEEAAQPKEKDEKHYDGEDSSHTRVEIYRPLGGSQSWDELDTYFEVEEMAQATRRATFEFERMTNNVLNDPMKSLSEKSSAIVALANGLPERVEDIQDEKDTWLEKIKEFIGKAQLTRASINNLPDSAFAYIESGGKKDEGGKTTPRGLRHYPIHDKAHIRNALSRAASAIKKGGKTAQIARRAFPKIRSAAKRMGIGKPAKSSFKVFKDKAGNWRWFGWVTNKWRDVDRTAAPKHGGEILTEAAHKDYVAWVDKNPEKRMPQLWPWHTKALAHTHKADWIDYADGFLLLSGPLTESEALGIKRLEEHYDLGMSHGFYAIDRDKKEALVTKYRTFEVGYLPLEYAANPWTDFLTVEKEVDMLKGLSPEKAEFLATLADEDFVAEVEADTEGKATILDEANIESKAKKKPKDKDAEKAPKPSGPSDFKELEKYLKMDELGKVLAGLQKTQKEQSGVLLLLATAVEKLAKDDDLKISEKLTPRTDVEKDVEPAWMKALSQSEETKIDEENDKDLDDSKPGLKEGHWMEEALVPSTETAPVAR